MNSLATISVDHSSDSSARQITVLIVLAGFADWLFYRQPLGVSIALFLAILAIAAAVANPVRSSLRDSCIAISVLAAGVAPLILGTGLIAVLFAVVATAYAALLLAHPDRDGWLARIGRSFWLIVDGSWQGFADFRRTAQRWSQGERTSIRIASLSGWIIPLILASIFAALFASANPLIEIWLTAIDPRTAFTYLSLPRLLFWIVAGLLVWPFISMRVTSRLREILASELRPLASELPASPVISMGKALVVRSLIIFNLMFAVQTALDIVYLWGGVALPAGMNYATYAHRGAYPLMLTALLAAGFVIAAMRPGSDTEKSTLVRNLVYLWTAQNILLVISAMLRLDLYIEIYSLTYLRVAAFVWMGLVAAGLVLIAARIAFGRTNSWLVRMNLISLGLVLYVCCFVNFPRIIADYNVAHSWEASGQGVSLDTAYLVSLGPQALPALDRHLEGRQSIPLWLFKGRNEVARNHTARLQNWRSWNYRDWQIARYLDSAGNSRFGGL